MFENRQFVIAMSKICAGAGLSKQAFFSFGKTYHIPQQEDPEAMLSEILKMAQRFSHKA